MPPVRQACTTSIRWIRTRGEARTRATCGGEGSNSGVERGGTGRRRTLERGAAGAEEQRCDSLPNNTQEVSVGGSGEVRAYCQPISAAAPIGTSLLRPCRRLPTDNQKTLIADVARLSTQ